MLQNGFLILRLDFALLLSAEAMKPHLIGSIWIAGGFMFEFKTDLCLCDSTISVTSVFHHR